MDDAPPEPEIDALETAIEDGAVDAARASLDRLATAERAVRKATVRTLKARADDRPATVAPVVPAVTPFLTDDERPMRLTAAKTLVTVAAAEPDAVTEAVPTLADRLADADEFYYVRARCAEALGYVAMERPGELSRGVLADFRIGLAFDEPAVREKLAKALEHVALGDPGRLTHQVSTLGESLDDGNELVRYHLTTALVIVACEQPTALADVTDALAARLTDENEYVRGRAAEALGLLSRTADDPPVPAAELRSLAADDEQFLAARGRFAADAFEGNGCSSEDIGCVDAIREHTADVVDDITTPETDGECPQCGLALPETGPPFCPRCGAPR